MTDPLDRIADALELLALTTWIDSPCNHDVCGALFDRIEARHAAQQTPANAPLVQPGDDSRFSPLAPSGGDSGHLSPPPDDDPEWRDVPAELAQCKSIRKGDRYYRINDTWHTARLNAGPNGTGRNWIKRHDHPARKPDQFDAPRCSACGGSCRSMDVDTATGERTYGSACAACSGTGRKPAPQTVDVLGRDLRVGDVVLSVCMPYGFDANGFPSTVKSVGEIHIEYTDDETSNSVMTHRVRLPRPAAEPSACGEGIARAEGTRLVVQGKDARSNIDAGTADFARWFAAEVNLAHIEATRELRERCERAEKRDASLVKRTADCTIQIDGLLREIRTLTADRDAAIARAEAAERVVEAMRELLGRLSGWADPGVTERSHKALGDYDRARKDGGK